MPLRLSGLAQWRLGLRQPVRLVSFDHPHGFFNQVILRAITGLESGFPRVNRYRAASIVLMVWTT
jgi:hypothetical protein